MTSRTILGIALIIVAIAIVFVGTKPFWDESQVLLLRKTELNHTLSEIQEMRKIYNGLLDKYKSIPKEDMSRLDQMLPDSPESALLLVDIENISKAGNLKLLNINLGGVSAKTTQSVSGNSYGSIQVGISITASYESFRTFLRALEESRRLIDVEQIAFSSSKLNSYQFSIQAAAHFKGTK